MSGARDLEPAPAARAMLADKRGRSYWRALEALLDQPDFRGRLAREIPALARMPLDPGRRDFLKCVAGAIALAGLDGCERGPDENAYPYVRAPDGVDPGEWRYYATAVELDGVAQPVIGKCRDGRPIKLEGNPDHPASLGATDAFTQAALLGLYDPERSAAPLFAGEPATWDAFEAAAFAASARFDATGGQGLRLLTGPARSPTLLRQIEAMQARWPQMRWHVHAPLGQGFSGTAAEASGRTLERMLRLDLAHAVVALDDDLLGTGPYQTWHARGWSRRRQQYQAGDGAALLYAAEPTPTLTGIAATDRLCAAHRRIGHLLAALALEFGVGGFPAPALNSREASWVRQAAAALERHRGSGLLTVGAHHPLELRQLALAVNARLGNTGETLQLVEPAAPGPVKGSLAALVGDMKAGLVDSLVVLETNPAYSAAPGLGLEEAMLAVPHRIHAGLHRDETALLCEWHLPLTHGLESWSDARAADGSVSIVQPLVRPFHDVRSRHWVLSALTGQVEDARQIVRSTWLGRWGGDERRWQAALVEGRIAGTAYEHATAPAPAPPALLPEVPANGLDVLFRADPTVHDGCFAGNPWLQETPKPVSKLTWDNAIHISPALAAELDLRNEQIAELTVGTAKLRWPVWIVPGQERRTIVLHLGYGRRAGGRIAEGSGFDAYALRSLASPWLRQGAELRATDEHAALACTQRDTTPESHDFIRFVSAAGEALPAHPPQANFYPPQGGDSPAWGMAIDLDLCIGCNACVVACVAENNVPMVGKEQVGMGREMHWLRIDRYVEGEPDTPKHAFQPVPCMHCENAPCEMGCPVNATVHSPDGLNLQVYNRCIGTRTCSAYCPYKVRRFNWLDLTRDDSAEMRAVRNPDVTVRDRGVMEKCTYCIQRIATARIEADKAGTPIPDGAVRTACQQACPTDAIVFGDIASADSAVSRRKRSSRDYALLEEANTRPRTTYAAKIAGGESET